MHAKCSSCNTYWNVSIYAEFPKDGYLCPRCRQRKKKEISKNEFRKRNTNRLYREF